MLYDLIKLRQRFFWIRIPGLNVISCLKFRRAHVFDVAAEKLLFGRAIIYCLIYSWLNRSTTLGHLLQEHVVLTCMRVAYFKLGFSSSLRPEKHGYNSPKTDHWNLFISENAWKVILRIETMIIHSRDARFSKMTC